MSNVNIGEAIAALSKNDTATAFINSFTDDENSAFYGKAPADVYGILYNMLCNDYSDVSFSENASDFDISFTSSGCYSYVAMYSNVNGQSYSVSYNVYKYFEISATGANQTLYNILEECKDTTKYTNIQYRFVQTGVSSQFVDIESLDYTNLKDHLWAVANSWTTYTDEGFSESEEIISLYCKANGDAGNLEIKRTVISEENNCPPHNFVSEYLYFDEESKTWKLQNEGEDYTGKCTCRDLVCSKCGADDENAPEYSHASEPLTGYAKCVGAECSICGVAIPGVGHNFDTWVVDRYPTCTEKGSRHQVCSECSQGGQTEEIEALGHKEVFVSEVPATCTETGLTSGTKCMTCDTIIEMQHVTPALGHDWDDGVVTKEPTETEQGVKTYTCRRCEATKTEPIAAVGHTHTPSSAVEENIIEATCTETGSLDSVVYCSGCGEELSREHFTVPALGHTPSDWITVKQPTFEEAGLRQIKCTTCNEVLKQEIIPALENSSEKLYSISDGRFEKIGCYSKPTDLSGYYTKKEADAAVSKAIKTEAESLKTEIAAKENKLAAGNAIIISEAENEGEKRTVVSVDGSRIIDINQYTAEMGNKADKATVATELAKKQDKLTDDNLGFGLVMDVGEVLSVDYRYVPTYNDVGNMIDSAIGNVLEGEY